MAEDPQTTIANLIKDKWDTSQTPMANPPEFSTTSWDRDEQFPQVSVEGVSEDVVNGGDTGVTALTGGGLAMQRLAGTVTVGCVAGTWAQCAGLAPDGSDLSPKNVRWELYDHVANLLVENATVPDNLYQVLPSTGTAFVDADEDADVDPAYGVNVTTLYLRDRRP